MDVPRPERWPVLITVAICTRNRAESLRRTLESLAAMRVPGDVAWEVVVVNNGGTDHTDQVIAAFASRLPIRREFEPQPGLSRARNRAVDAANGDYIVWTDDDVIVDPGWLAAYAEAFRRWPEAAVFGGRITPRLEEPVPRWFLGTQALWIGMLGTRDFGDADLPLCLAGERLPYGPNFAIRAIEQRKYRYDTELGHAPGQGRRGEEMDVVERLLRSGASGYWVPQAKVEHCFTRGQLTTPCAARFYASIGETVAFRDRPAASGEFWLGAPRWLWRQMIEQWLRYRVHRWISPPSVWARHLVSYAMTWGTIRYWRGRSGVNMPNPLRQGGPSR